MPSSNVRISNDFSAYPALYRQSTGLTDQRFNSASLCFSSSQTQDWWPWRRWTWGTGGYNQANIGNCFPVTNCYVLSSIFLVLQTCGPNWSVHQCPSPSSWWTFIWQSVALLLLFGLVVKVSAEGDGLVHKHEVGGTCCSSLILHAGSSEADFCQCLILSLEPPMCPGNYADAFEAPTGNVWMKKNRLHWYKNLITTAAFSLNLLSGGVLKIWLWKCSYGSWRQKWW